MLLRLGYDMLFDVPEPVACVAQLRVHPSRIGGLRGPDHVQVEPNVAIEEYTDSFGNLCTRFLAPPGRLRLRNDFLFEDPGLPDPASPYPLPLWHLVSDSNSVPVMTFFYGQNLRGLQPQVPGSRPQPLATNVAYRLCVTAGKYHGENIFVLK